MQVPPETAQAQVQQQVEAGQLHSGGHGELLGRGVEQAQAQADDRRDSDGKRQGRVQRQPHTNEAQCGYAGQRAAAKQGPGRGGGPALHGATQSQSCG